MASQRKIVEGIFAINKPALKTSAQVLRDLQTHFNHSALFAPWLAEQREMREQESRFQKNRRRKHKRLEVKIGHGGTLDPMATGVLVVGVGKGTKSLSMFLGGCTKTYETTVVFGAASDTYDITGKLLQKASTAGVTKETVESALEKFKGDIMQTPPIYSALKVQGKKLYEYAREGKEPPISVEARPVKVDKIEVTEWLEPGKHSFKLPQEEADIEEKVAAKKLVGVGEEDDDALGLKRKRDGGEGEASDNVPEPPAKKVAGADEAGAELQASLNEEPVPDTKDEEMPRADGISTSKDGAGDFVPAARLSITSHSGFYVRSLCHDLGKAVDSLGLMGSLLRTKQADFELGKNVFDFNDLEKGEEVWGPKVEAMLTKWASEQEDSDG